MTGPLRFTTSPETEELYKLFSAAAEGDIITYEDMAKKLSVKVEDVRRSCIHSALKRALRDDGLLFDCLRKVGYKRLSPAEGVALGQDAITRGRRHARRSVIKQQAVDYAKLSSEDQVVWNTQMTVLRLMHRLGEGRSVKAIESQVESGPLPLPKAFRHLAGDKEEP